MSGRHDDPFLGRYEDALRNYVAEASEEPLQDAFELGRELLERGASIMDLAQLHARALGELLWEAANGGNTAEILERGFRLLDESLGSFDMMLLGAQDANLALRQLNENLTERVEQRARELEQARSRLQQAIEHSPAALYALRLSPAPVEYLYMSPQAERLFGVRTADVTRELVETRIHEDDLSLVHASLERAFATGGSLSSDYRLRAGHGKYIFVHDQSEVVTGADGERVMHGVITDVTAKVELQQQLLHIQGMDAMGKLAGGIAHDFNNLLTVILAFARLMMDDLAEGDPRAEDLREILRAADSAVGLTDQLLAFSRRQVVEPRVMRPQDALPALEKMIRRTVGQDVVLTAHYDDNCGQIRVDPSQLDQVMLNLVINARDAMPTGGNLRLEARRLVLPKSDNVLPAGDYVEIDVADTGVGMTEEVKSRIFEPFFTTKGKRGTGLGLSTCYGIVRQAGGDIRAETEVGRGTVMRVLLPMVAEVTSEQAPELEPPTTATGHVLVVEDQPALLRMLTRVLKSAGYCVTGTSGAEEALDVLERGDKPDLLITDLAMPGMNGAELIERARASRPDLPVLVISAYVSLEGQPRQSELLRTLPTLRKPFTPAQLRARVQVLLEHTRSPHG